MRSVYFTAIEEEGKVRDGEGGWRITVDGKPICDIDNDDLDVGNHALDHLWWALGVQITFDFDRK
jgi:hypothetical protein